MIDNENNNDLKDARKVVAEEPYSAAFFAKKHGITVDRAEMLFQKFGLDRETLDIEAEKLLKTR